jgi:D-arabinose 1-dehydrogenase-like Zn-dependent alcohol dehydrogenase
MHAMVPSESRTMLWWTRKDDPRPARGKLLVGVHDCGVCRPDLHVADGELLQARYPIVPGHDIVGTVVALGSRVQAFAGGDRADYVDIAIQSLREGGHKILESARQLAARSVRRVASVSASRRP